MAIGSVWGPDTWGDCWADCWGDAVDAVVNTPAPGGHNPFAAFLRQAVPRRPPLDLEHRGSGGFAYAGNGSIAFEPAPVTETAHSGEGGFEVEEIAGALAFDNQVVIEARRAARRAAIIFG